MSKKKSKEGSYGFVYLWYDRKQKRFYVGSHWGFEDDGYVCSNPGMKENRRYRPETFKRRILSKVYTNRHDLLSEEQRWLDMIKPEEFGRRYYNKNAKATFYAWWMNDDTKAEVGRKINTPERNAKISQSLKGKYTGENSYHSGRKRSDATKQKMRDNAARPCLGKKQSTELIAKRSVAIKEGWANQSEEKRKAISMERSARSHTDETKQKMRSAAILREERKRLLNNTKSIDL